MLLHANFVRDINIEKKNQRKNHIVKSNIKVICNMKQFIQRFKSIT